MRKIFTIIIAVLALALVYTAYVSFIKPKASTDTDAAAVTRTAGDAALATGPAAVTSNEFLNLLQALKQVHFSTTLFQDPTFTSLQDFHKALPDRSVGRDNPFAPFESAAVVQFNGGPTTA